MFKGQRVPTIITNNSLLKTLSIMVITALTLTTQPLTQAYASHKESTQVQTQITNSKLAPPVVGMNLANAQLFAKKYGVKISYKDHSDAKREVKYPEQWHIVSQSLEPGTKLKKNKKISVTVLKHGENLENIAAMKPADIANATNNVMLNLVGLNLKEAHERVEAENLYILEETDGTGENRSVFRKSSWTVVAQDTPPGKTERGVTLTIKKNKEVQKNDLQKTWDQQDLFVSAYFGKVTGYETDTYIGSNEKNIVVVDKTPVELDLISPYPSACFFSADDKTSQTTKSKTLPVNTEVLVRFKSSNEKIGFIHNLKQIRFENLPQNSANELLVETGDWVPNHYGFQDSDVVSGNTVVYQPLEDWSGFLTETEIPYALLILQAGTEVRTNPVGGVVTCLEQVAAMQENRRQLEIESKEARRQWDLEYERRKAAGWYSCRDGDGDGYCNER